MGKISLRAYNHEIETLIERGHTEEAIAHCKYILKTYPKHLDTYRLLGKAFLESQRYSEAADILQRILSVLPDDFVAQIGMSIIREDEGNLDAAIYHMERAFEIQPSNAAIQDELRRLYGRRDGLEPSKLRLTRGALVRMYARGDLYRQAIAEARAAIVEDPQRLDLEIVLARMYSHTGQKAEAAEICSRLVSKLPFCLEANRILAEVLPETSRAEDAKIYQQRLVALDPYLAYTSESAMDVHQVQDNAVTVDRLEWAPSLENDQQPTWAKSLGIQIVEKETESVPNWMSEMPDPSAQAAEEQAPAQPFSEEPSLFESGIETASPMPDQEPAPSTDIPDWMQSIGWSISGQPAQTSPTEQPAAPEQIYPDDSEIAAAPAEIPDWLKDIAPSAQSTASASPDDQQNLDWFSSILPPENTSNTEAVPAIENSFTEPATPQPLVQGQEPAAIENDELPDWLKSGSPASDETLFADQNQEPLPDWLTESVKMHTEPLTPEEIPPQQVGSQPEQKPVVEATQPVHISEQTTGENFPTKMTAAAVEPAAAQEASAPDLPMDDAMGWLESLAARQGADEETLLTRPDERVETPPDWVSRAFETVQPSSPVEETPAAAANIETPVVDASVAPVIETGEVESVSIPTEEIAPPTVVEIPGQQIAETPIAEQPEPVSSAGEIPAMPMEEPSQAPETEISQPQDQIPAHAVASQPDASTPENTDMDAAFAWLESLAAKHGAAEDSLLVAPDDRQETAPGWIQQQSEITDQVQESEPEPSMPAGTPSSSHIADWILDAEDAPISDEATQAEPAELPDWLKKLESSPDATVEPVLPEEEAFPSADIPAETPVSPQAEKTDLDWFQEFNESPAEKSAEVVPLAEKPAEELPLPPEENPLPVTRELGKTRPLPSWLAGGAAKPPAEVVQPEPEPEVPQWMQVDQPVEATPSAAIVEPSAPETPELPDWLKNLETESQEALPGVPVMSMPAEAAPAAIEVSSNPDEMVVQAQTALGKGQVDLALSIYDRLIPQGKHLEETIHDLRDALYRFPVESSIWQTLGDACMRDNRMQEALDAYTKAEELLK